MPIPLPTIRIPVRLCQGIFATGVLTQLGLFSQICVDPNLAQYFLPYIIVFTGLLAGFEKEQQGDFIVLYVSPIYTVMTFMIGCTIWGAFLGSALTVMDRAACFVIGIQC
ncbi:hypothetical protein BT96DRAFT_1003684 [Gymnopus androsaceus JB14]|uniref:Uncharacterized protein n=1 Tax=Gymnopus androsaceus JB14 TaxID=1447944 RepID=A0A6A4GU85_9AGAR|nr:hypothetical protein BT96DRAFT_1003684 [Gymnopus androsaceus JB14]